MVDKVALPPLAAPFSTRIIAVNVWAIPGETGTVEAKFQMPIAPCRELTHPFCEDGTKIITALILACRITPVPILALALVLLHGFITPPDDHVIPVTVVQPIVSAATARAAMRIHPANLALVAARALTLVTSPVHLVPTIIVDHTDEAETTPGTALDLDVTSDSIPLTNIPGRI